MRNLNERESYLRALEIHYGTAVQIKTILRTIL